MKRAVVKGIGIALVIVGFFVVLGAAGNADLGASLGNVIMQIVSGAVTVLFGAAMVRYIEAREI